MSAQILPLQAALDARTDARRVECFRMVERFRMLDPFKKQEFLRLLQDMEAHNKEETAGRKNVVDLGA